MDKKIELLVERGIDIHDNTIYLTGDIDSDTYETVVIGIQAITHYGNKDKNLTVMLSTYGGDVYYGLAIYDVLKIFGKESKIICSGPVMSAGGIILQAGTERVMMPNSTLMLHFGQETNSDTATKHHHEHLGKVMKGIIGERATVKKETVRKWFTKESYFTAERALEVGLVDRIVGKL